MKPYIYYLYETGITLRIVQGSVMRDKIHIWNNLTSGQMLTFDLCNINIFYY